MTALDAQIKRIKTGIAEMEFLASGMTYSEQLELSQEYAIMLRKLKALEMRREQLEARAHLRLVV